VTCLQQLSALFAVSVACFITEPYWTPRAREGGVEGVCVCMRVCMHVARVCAFFNVIVIVGGDYRTNSLLF